MHGVRTSPVEGATAALLELHRGVDIMDEWALLPQLDAFPVVVAPEQDRMSDEMVEALKAWVKTGGKLLVSGADAYARFGGAFLGVRKGKMQEDQTYHVPAADGSFAAWSQTWHLTGATKASVMGKLATTPLLDDRLLPQGAAFLNRVGRGAVAYIPFDVFHFFQYNHYPLCRAFLGELMRILVGKLPITVQAPTCVDVVLRRKGSRSLVHLINRVSGIPNLPHDGTVDEIPAVGPIQVDMQLMRRPKSVRLAFEKAPLEWRYHAGKRGGKLVARLERVDIHAALVVEE